MSHILPATFRVSSTVLSGGIFDADFTQLFPDLPDSDKPETTLAMHQSPDSTMFWISGREGIILRVGVERSHPRLSIPGECVAFSRGVEFGFYACACLL